MRKKWMHVFTCIAYKNVRAGVACGDDAHFGHAVFADRLKHHPLSVGTELLNRADRSLVRDNAACFRRQVEHAHVAMLEVTEGDAATVRRPGRKPAGGSDEVWICAVAAHDPDLKATLGSP